MPKMILEKTEKISGILQEEGIDLWLTFVRESSIGGDPIMPLIFGEQNLTWQSMLIFTRSGESIAIVGNLELDTAQNLGIYDHVIGYDKGIQENFLEVLQRINPGQIAINTSLSNVRADGLRHGMYQKLVKLLEDTPWRDRLCSAEGIIAKITGRKTPTEVSLIRDAVKETEEIFQETYDFVKVGMTEKDVADFMHQCLAERGLEAAWDYEGCPIVNAGPDSPMGHALPGDRVINAGEILHLDFGVKKNGYCSDIQRVIYFLKDGEQKPPEAVQQAFDVISMAERESTAKIRPGIIGKDIDQIARDIVVEGGFPEFKHALGHQLGQFAHDGGSLLGPGWPKYGEKVTIPLEAGQVFTVEPSLLLPGYGIIGLEEDVLITEDGADYLSTPQRNWILK
ncbi:MAG: aminopeptidase P family protein [Anaerolineaceae bacterium]|nr:aminopeptidase P family protein [Anaerolineaceae bacterium]